MKKILLLLFVHFSINIFAQETGIKFIEDRSLASLLQKADSAKKLVFLDCYATWCGPCKYLSKNIFPLKEVGDFYNASFICAKFDMEKGEGIEIAKRYHIRAYPTLLFLNSKGELEHIQVGSGDAATILALGAKAKDPVNNYKAINTRMKKEGLNAEILQKLLDINPYASNIDSLLNAYYATLKDENRVSVETWNLINKYIEDYENSFFKLLLNNEEKFKKIASPKEVDDKILQTFITYISKNRNNSEKSASIEKELKALNHPQVKKAYENIEFGKLYSKVSRGEVTAENWKAFLDGAKTFLKDNTEWVALNKIAWFVYENYKKVNDLEALKTAKEWALKSTQIDKNAANLDTYANIVYDLGETAEAIKTEEEALSIAQKENDTEMITSLKERIDFFKNNKKN